MGGTRFLIRDYTGQVLLASSICFPAISFQFLELRAAWEGLMVVVFMLQDSKILLERVLTSGIDFDGE